MKTKQQFDHSPHTALVGVALAKASWKSPHCEAGRDGVEHQALKTPDATFGGTA